MRRIIVAREINDVQNVTTPSINRLNRQPINIDADAIQARRLEAELHKEQTARAWQAPIIEA